MAWKLDFVKKGARKANRDMSKLDIWARLLMNVADTEEEARKEVTWYPRIYGTIYRLLEAHSPEANDLREKLESLEPGLVAHLCRDSRLFAEAFDPYSHVSPKASHGELGTPRLMQLYHLVGVEDQLTARIRELVKLGINNISTVVFGMSDKVKALERISDKIMPHFRSGYAN